MTQDQSVTDLNLSDAELIELLKTHGIDRRSVMKVFGVGAGLALGTGSATAKHDDPHSPHIDSHYGYGTPDADDIPEKLAPDHEIELHVIPPIPTESQPPLFHFEPAGLSVDPGDIVQFTATFADHTITPYHPAHGFQRRVPKAVPPFSSPVINVGGAWLYQFETEGLYDLYCGPHHVLGMAMRIVVGDLCEKEIPDYEDTFAGSEGPPPLLAPFSKERLEGELQHLTAFIDGENNDCEWVWLTPKEVLNTDALDPENIPADGRGVVFDDVLRDIERVSIGHTH